MSTHQTSEPFSDAALRLQQASRRISQQRDQRAQWEEEFGRIIGLLDSKIMTNAPDCEHRSSEDGWEWRRSDAVLRVGSVQQVGEPRPLDSEAIAYSSIAIYWRGNREWSHSLWYCQAESGGFRWYEVAFSNMPRELPSIHFVKEPNTSDYIGDEVCHPVFCKIVDPAEFSERWAGWFAEADSATSRMDFGPLRLKWIQTVRQVDSLT